MLARFVVVSLVALIAVACTAGAISRDRAIELALQAGGDSTVPPSMVAVESGPLADFVDEGMSMVGPRDRRVWAITLAGDFRGECVPAADGTLMCPRGAGTKLVVLDRSTGEFLYSASP
jgi:hypothetical protein